MAGVSAFFVVLLFDILKVNGLHGISIYISLAETLFQVIAQHDRKYECQHSNDKKQDYTSGKLKLFCRIAFIVSHFISLREMPENSSVYSTLSFALFLVRIDVNMAS